MTAAPSLKAFKDCILLVAVLVLVALSAQVCFNVLRIICVLASLSWLLNKHAFPIFF